MFLQDVNYISSPEDDENEEERQMMRISSCMMMDFWRKIIWDLVGRFIKPSHSKAKDNEPAKDHKVRPLPNAKQSLFFLRGLCIM